MSHSLRAPRVLVFDSGVGGLSVLQEVRQRLPACEFVYASDNAFFPYGVKGETELIERVDRVLHAVLDNCAVDIIVVACNTASTLTLPHIRSHFSQPIVGVVPAIKPAAARSRSKVIGLLATPATVARPYTLDLISHHAADCTVIKVGSSELVLMAERKLRGQTIEPSALSNILAPFYNHPQAAQLDTLVLACTHFPLLGDELRNALPETVDLIDSGEAIARRVEFLFGDHFGLQLAELTAPVAAANAHLALFTEQTAAVELLAQPLLQFGIGKMEFIRV